MKDWQLITGMVATILLAIFCLWGVAYLSQAHCTCEMVKNHECTP